MQRFFGARPRTLVAVLCAGVCLIATAPRTEGAAASSLPFAPSSIWNAPLPADAPLDPLSAAYSNDVVRQVAEYGTWINTTRDSSPVYTVPAGQPTVRVTVDKNAPDLQAAFERVPIPPSARPAAGADHTMVVWQPSTDTMWELWQAYKLLGRWHMRYGGRIDHLSTNPGYYVDHPRWGATATSLPVLGGLMRPDELQAGHIDHALALALPETRSSFYSLPAQRTDGTVNQPSAIPEGARFRLDPQLDLSRLTMDPVVRVMAEAAQRYGMVVRDRAGAVALYAEDTSSYGWDPYPALFDGRSPAQLLAQFPWSHLQALKTDLRFNPS